MQTENPTVAIIGATGKFASLLIPELRRRNVVVRALVRNESRADAALAAGAAQAVVADLGKPDRLVEAVNGVDGIFHIGPAFAPDESEMGVALVNAAERAGVRKFVFSSVIQPTNVRLANHASKIPVEDALYSSRLDYTILHPANFMQNIGLAWPSIVEHGIYAEPFPNDTRIARVDYRDVAELAARALTSDELSFATLELCAGMHSRSEIVALLSEALGRPIQACMLPFDEWAAMARLPYDGDQLAMLSKVHDHYARYGLGGNCLSLKAALGREPRSLGDYIQELAQRGNGAPA